MLLEVFLDSPSCDGGVSIAEKLIQISKLASIIITFTQCHVEKCKECKYFIDEFEALKSKVRTGLLRNTAQFWLSYCDSVWILLRFHKAVKDNNLALYIHSLRQMCPILFSADHLFYARYLRRDP